MTLRLGLIALLLLIAAGSGVQSASPVRAEGITLQSQQAQNSFPEGINFTVTATSDKKITQSRLRFAIQPRAIQNTIRGECTGETTVNCKAKAGGSIGTNTAYIVPFAEIRYYWELTDEAGNMLTTPEEKVVYQDTRFRWKNISEGNLTLYWYQGDESDVRGMLKAGRETIDQMSSLLGTTVDFPVKVVEYATVRDLQLATSRGRRGGNPNSVLLGEVGTDDTALATRQVFSGMADPLDTVRHELTHVVTNYALRGAPGTDSWIEEGISMYSQKIIEGDYSQALDLAIKSNKVYPISSLAGSAARSNDPSLYYAQSHSLIKYTIDKYGQDKFRYFIKELTKGGTNDAMKTAFGVELNTFENDWRKTLALGPVEQQSGTSSNTGPVILTLEPLSNPQSSGGRSTPQPGLAGSSNAKGGDGGSSSALPIVGVVVAAVVVLGGAGAVLMRRKRA